MKTSTLPSKELLSWILLLIAIVLFSFSFSFAQDKKQNKKSEMRIKIQKEENGKKTKIDTTITSDQLPAIKEYLKDLDIHLDAELKDLGSINNENNSGGNVTMRFRHPEMSKEEREEFEKEMKSLKKELKGLDEKMKDINIELDGLDDLDPENFDLHLKMPGAPCMPPSPNSSFYFYGNEGDEELKEFENKIKFRFHSGHKEVPDSLNNEDHIIVYGSKEEGTPELKQEMTTKDGDKIFIYKRKLPKKEEPKASTSMPVTKVKVYPNPGNGKLSVSFSAPSTGDIEISISNANGKEVYSKKLKDFSGEYFNQVNISENGKGTYFLKITQGGDSITKKLVVE